MQLNVGIIGGSLGGLTAALFLKDAGCDVTVFERSPEPLTARGAGIVLHDSTTRYFTERGSDAIDSVATLCQQLQYLDRDGSIQWEAPSDYRFVSYSALWGSLMREFGLQRYVHGESLVGFDAACDGVGVRFASGRQERFDLLVCADGVSSTARQRLAPERQPEYSGYVGWRGFVDESRLSLKTRECLYDNITYGVIDNSHIVAYNIPHGDGTNPAGKRLMNFVWYRNVPEGSQLDELMTDLNGVNRPISMHPGTLQHRYVDEIRRSAHDLLPPQLAEMVVQTQEPFIQAIVDVQMPRTVFGRICVIGDAAFAARPHAASGTAKAAEDGYQLSKSLANHGFDVDAALADFEPKQLKLGCQLVARAREMGHRSQFASTWKAGDPSLMFGLYGPGR